MSEKTNKVKTILQFFMYLLVFLFVRNKQG